MQQKSGKWFFTDMMIKLARYCSCWICDSEELLNLVPLLLYLSDE